MYRNITVGLLAVWQCGREYKTWIKVISIDLQRGCGSVKHRHICIHLSANIMRKDSMVETI